MEIQKTSAILREKDTKGMKLIGEYISDRERYEKKTNTAYFLPYNHFFI